MKQFYEDFFVTDANKANKKELDKQELRNLYRKPKKEKREEMGNFDIAYEPNMYHQADLLFMPEDDGFKYALVVVDLATHLCDAEPLSNKTSQHVKEAFHTIYNRDILSIPTFLTMDSGSEFKGEIKKYCDKNEIDCRYGKPKRHRALAVVETTNKYLSKGLFMKMTAQELLTGEPSREWVEDLPKFVEYVNKKRKRKPPTPPKDNTVKCSGDDCKLLLIGTKVRVKLDHPKDVATDKNLHGKFRVTDIRWDPEIRTITNIIMDDGQPPMYHLNDPKHELGVDTTARYTKKQLQVVPENEQKPPKTVIRGKPTQYVVEKIIGKKKVKGRIYYKVQWAGHPNENTWEPRTTLIEDIPEMIIKYEKEKN